MYHIILNPAAGHGRSVAILPQLTTHLAAHCVPFETLPTAAPGAAREIAAKACRDGSDGIIGIGGDGTLQEIVTGMRDAHPDAGIIPTPLGVLPCGSGNDFSLTFEGKKKTKSEERIRSLTASVADGQTIPVDLINISGGQICMNIANMGLDARIVQNAESYKQRFGGNAYLAASYKSISQHKNIKMTIEADDEIFAGDFTLAAVCNGQYYGGGLRISPRARLNDGLITLCIVDKLSRAKTSILFPSVLFERHVNLKEVHYVTCKRVKITADETEILCVDGNLYGHPGTLEFNMLPGAIRMFAP
ncbi:MAG: diacylglycerol kinase family lipid kinase [Clostridiales bacterium]|jgi:YegS/Rv2252/BmrU family lipid kinase|nr:diacylglycerol kinase family lipid kinase [Clostridiales bacterium]